MNNYFTFIPFILGKMKIAFELDKVPNIGDAIKVKPLFFGGIDYKPRDAKVLDVINRSTKKTKNPRIELLLDWSDGRTYPYCRLDRAANKGRGKVVMTESDWDGRKND